MRRPKVVFSNKGMNVPYYIEYGRNIVIKMTGNANFSNPDIPLATITTLCNTAESKYLLSQDGSRISHSELRQALVALKNGIRTLGLYVERKADGNETIILSSGFKASKQPIPAKRPTFEAKLTDKEGSIMLRHNAKKSARSHVWQYSPDPITATSWIFAGVSTQSKFIINNLKAGAKYWFRASQVTKEGQSEWCQPHSKVVSQL